MAIITTAIAVIATFFVSRLYYKKSSKDTVGLKGDISRLESLDLAMYRIQQTSDPNRTGHLIKTEDGKYAVRWDVVIKEQIHYKDDVVVVKNPEKQLQEDKDDKKTPET